MFITIFQRPKKQNFNKFEATHITFKLSKGLRTKHNTHLKEKSLGSVMK